MHDSFFACHHSELFWGTKKVKIQNCQIGLKFLNLANNVARTRKSEKLEKKIFWCDVIDFFFRFFFEMSICFDGNRSARYDLLMVDDQDIGLALKLGALGADKPPANNTYYFGSKLRIFGKTFLHVISDFEMIKKIFRKSIRG